MVGYDKNLDKQIYNRVIENPGFNILLSIWSYNHGGPKIQLIRYSFNEEKLIFAKLGRLTQLEAESIMEFLPEACKFIENWDKVKVDLEFDIKKGEKF